MSILITENEKNHILNLYGLMLEDLRTPLEKLLECKITNDGKYIIFEGKSYNTQTGDEVPLNEAWTLSDILHTSADLASVGADFILPGSGAVIDVLNAISYIIEAQFKPAEERDSLYLMGAITLAFAIIPGPLQAVAPALKTAVKSGAGFTSKAVVGGLKIVATFLDKLLLELPSYAAKALKSKFAKSILGKYAKEIPTYLTKFTTRIKQILSPLKGGADTAVQAGTKAGVKGAAKATMTKAAKSNLTSFFGRLPKFANGEMVMRKLGFVPGKAYSYVTGKGKATKATIESFTNGQVTVLFKNAKGNISKLTFPFETFVQRAVGAPWGHRGYSTLVPLFVKRLSDVILQNGALDEKTLSTMEDLDPNVTSAESLEYMSEVLSPYEGDSGAYSVNQNVSTFQNALKLIGFKLGNFGPNKDGVDGKFGPQTQTALKEFQTQNGLQSSIGKMDRYTARKLAEVLKTKSIPGSETIISALESI
jgi:hypothetical protein